MGCGSSTANASKPQIQRTKTNTIIPEKITVVKPREPRNGDEFLKEFTWVPNGTLGEGAFGNVVKATRISTGEVVAVKVVKEAKQDLKMEAALLECVDHPHVMRFYDFLFKTPDYLLVTELIEGGELFDRIIEKGSYNEYEAMWVMKKLLKITRHLHALGMVHRDYKPENLLLKSRENNHDIRLVDFGHATIVNGRDLEQRVGTPGYAAPEVLQRQKYGVEVDLWSSGVLAFILLSGSPPFRLDKPYDINVVNGTYKFATKPWEKVSSDAKSLVVGLLTVNQDQRLTPQQALDHSWFRLDKDEIRNNELAKSLENLKSFNATRKLRGAMHAVLTTCRATTGGLLSHVPDDSGSNETSSADLERACTDLMDTTK